MLREGMNMRLILGVAFICRLILAFSPSYFHPDEHLQGPQEIAYGMFGWASQTPWEFTSEHPIRSFVPLWLLYGIPMRFFHKDSNPLHVLWTLRAVFAVLTWVLEDMAVERLAVTRNDKLRCLFFVSTSYATLTWQAHTFSNSLETILVLWFLVILFEAESSTSQPFMSPFDRYYDNFLLGMIVTLGIFNRPTFLAFISFPSLCLPNIWRKSYGSFFVFLFSLCLTTGLFIGIDTYLYNSDTWVIAPLNFALYNTSSNNLAEHGTHSRLQHLFTNLPTLLGPGLLMLKPNWHSLPVQTIAGGLLFLSLIPHQEARFLLPLVPLICMQMDLKQYASATVRKTLMILWLTFNLFCAIFLGLYHQSGVIPAQVHISELARPLTVIWWKTYTPPLWITGLPHDKVEFGALSDIRNDLDYVRELASKGAHTDASYDDSVDADKRDIALSANDTLIEIDLQGANTTILKEIVELCGDKEVLVMVPDAVKDQFFSIFNTDPVNEKGTKSTEKSASKEIIPPRVWRSSSFLSPDLLFQGPHFWSSPWGLSMYNVSGLNYSVTSEISSDTNE
ncbi:glycosylphosphatidylinositol-alpha 1,2 mannosyltransferase [Starmerella bacillaris]|uniref:Mannosyltransferase n=1 Tax=Starmerella bacillaris TaxID=1247836 RepID=A0AAV5RHM0_STABA|nr:glycosylphosphatidylinositol-alpha 1,2 mannosyltransferase [Starmerella bacillaris]